MFADPLDLRGGDEPIGTPERVLASRGVRWVVGADEAGRGPLAGPVMTAAVLLSLDDLAWCEGLDDSKALDALQRETLARRVRSHALAFEWHAVERDEIDRVNIVQASLAGMRVAVEAVLTRAGIDVGDPRFGGVLVDGRQRLPGLLAPQRALIRGDARSWAIAAASILAKVERDRICDAYDERWPEWGFAQHRGYPTPAHRRRLASEGPLPIHRRSFGPVARGLAAEAEGSTET